MAIPSWIKAAIGSFPSPVEAAYPNAALGYPSFILDIAHVPGRQLK